MTKIQKLIIGLLAISAAVALGLISQGNPMFAGTKSLIFTQDAVEPMRVPTAERLSANPNFDTPSQMKLVITNSVELRHFLSSIHLRKKEPCWCLHLHHATFETPKRKIEVSFCSHCFDISEGKATRFYEMPRAFYDQLLQAIRRQGQKG